MTTPAEQTADWRSIAAMDDAAQVSTIRDRMQRIARHTEADLAREVANFVQAEVDSDDATMSRLTRNRLRAWLQLDGADVERLATAVAAARETMPGPSAMRNTMAVQAAVRDLDRDEVIQLVEMAPVLRDSVSTEMLEAITTVAHIVESEQSGAPPPPESMRTRKPWWKFW
jgi:hypothetical protein